MFCTYTGSPFMHAKNSVALNTLKRSGCIRPVQRRLAPCAAAVGSKKKGSRRNFFAAALVVGPSILLSGEPALAFGTGIPGYDVNVAARQRATDIVNAEKAYQKSLADGERAKRKAAIDAAKAAEANP
eukprot:CAMPEP_0198209340 /NCGR_PEP_ID=MMETSP1445-20131203/15044_1 /TAXON_ID=36898 /ORGANISM="Pyramimonas sp., Strain CCMP2087" /LENGTH=127 /DNA_ID=CAMNT_0043883089 /DNA_START=87 /DNA_END=470 /DNA_ORIENTATION=-